MGFMERYEQRYKLFFLVPIILLILSAGIITWNVVEDGTFVDKGVTLSGGVSATVTIEAALSSNELQDAVEAAFPGSDVQVRELNTFGTSQSYVVDAANIGGDEQEAAEQLEAFLHETYSVVALTTETTGPSLGDAFFNQTIVGIMLAFLWMGWVVYLYFGDRLSMKIGMALFVFILTILAVQGFFEGGAGMLVLALIVLATMIMYLWISVPSGAVILAAASTIVFTLAVIDLIGMRLSTAGVAAFLMLIGYSVDTDILLSTRVLKEHTKPLNDRIVGAFQTGITMQLTTTAAVLAALLLTNSEVIRQIMLIILIGMAGDIIFTWLQNAGIIYWYVKREGLEKKTAHRRRAKA